MSSSNYISFYDPSDRDLAVQLWQEGVESVRGETATRNALIADQSRPWEHVLSIGKAGSSMMLGAVSYLAEDGKALVVTKTDHADEVLIQDPRITVIESGHPVPDGNSILAGSVAWDFVGEIGPDSDLLVLVSGGASALVEFPLDGIDLDTLKELNEQLLADGYSIDQINSIRVLISRIKGGKLLGNFRGQRLCVYGISDIPGDDADLIGSGIAALKPPQVAPFDIAEDISNVVAMARSVMETTPETLAEPPANYASRLIGSNTLARNAVSEAATRLGLNVIEQAELIDGDILPLADTLAKKIATGKPGVYIWGGESTVRLPDNPGYGGRNQSLSLALVLALTKYPEIDWFGVVAGTDGTDGPTHAAGGIVHAGMVLEGAQKAIDAADAGNWLQQVGALFVTGPTGTNVMDLIVVVKRS